MSLMPEPSALLVPEAPGSRPGVTSRAEGTSDEAVASAGSSAGLPSGGVNQKNSVGGSSPGSLAPTKLTTTRKACQSNGFSPCWCRSSCQSRMCCSRSGFASISSDMYTSRNMSPSSLEPALSSAGHQRRRLSPGHNPVSIVSRSRHTGLTVPYQFRGVRAANGHSCTQTIETLPPDDQGFDQQ